MQNTTNKTDNPASNKALQILVVDDEQGILDFISLGLEYEGFEVKTATDGNRGLEIALHENPDLIILDLMLPGIDGLELCRRLRAFYDVPIIMLTARDEIDDRVQGLNMGADDYLTKPFSFKELLARVRAVLRRKIGGADTTTTQPKAEGLGQPVDRKLTYGDIILDPASHEVLRNGVPIELTLREYELLLLFMRHPRLVLNRDKILENVWGYEYLGDSNIIEVYVRYLRHKLGEPNPIQTIRGVGYIFR
ncbi:MAG: response regulator transcription factor [Chloroflexi bacterium]|nr:response regulator transcription factor [Chloroflexota bacterium]OJV90646.1 MAG: hypothetical protein BGO39_19730 [Chloroflexi bacterium 54-19]